MAKRDRKKARVKTLLITDSQANNPISWWILKLYLRFKGWRPKRVTPENQETFKDFDGLILLGGGDINPERYGEKSFKGIGYDDKRDAMEMRLVKEALDGNKPILAICRGMQLLNVALGGSLYQNVSEVFDDFLPTTSTLGKIFARRKVFVKKESKLFKILGKKEAYTVNSLHHQGVNKVGEGLTVSATQKSGLVQAIEREKEGAFAIGVQWHPEYILHYRSSRRLIKAFLKAIV